ncbi:putative phosphorylase b kinase regulatory subunit alpha [Toxocara canis]|uniref:Phosphorylase b kinase regulatory subunit n=1 Tax=Toxocara canis TaxID=6265 RepID=A0A0B2V4M0_TOXCA|nr:putative phosphorylase b kinase regulatory subunit alpha [Toxocara canis]
MERGKGRAQFMDRRRSHLMYDISILMDEWSSELQYIYSTWNSTSVSGRPLVVLIVAKNMLEADSSYSKSSFTSRHMISTVVGTIKKIATGYIGGARVVMKDISEFFRTTAVSKLEFQDGSVDDLVSEKEELEARGLHRNLPSAVDDQKLCSLMKGRNKKKEVVHFATPKKISGSLSIRDRNEQFDIVQKMSMRHRSVMLDSNDADLAKLRLAYANRQETPRGSDKHHNASPTRLMSPFREKHSSPPAEELPKLPAIFTPNALQTTSSSSSMKSASSDSEKRLDAAQMDEMSTSDLIDMLTETSVLDEQASIVHYLWMKKGPDFDTKLNGIEGSTVRMLAEEIYGKACEIRDWALVRLTAGLLNRQLDELTKAVTHLLVRQKQITLGIPSKKEEAITCPKTKEELSKILARTYGDDPNSYILSQVSLFLNFFKYYAAFVVAKYICFCAIRRLFL